MFSRRAFIRACSVLALGFAGCSGLIPDVRFARLFIPSPHRDDYLPILLAAIRAVLPLDDPRFPKIAPETIADQLNDIFPLQDPKYAILVRSIMYFDETILFFHVPQPLIEDERSFLEESGMSGLAIESAIEKRQQREEDIYRRFRAAGITEEKFRNLSLESARSYVNLWKQSGFIAKRQFHDAIKTLVMVTAYSRDDVWPAIGYKGPLLTIK
jgi:hypothetical protein